MKTITRVFQKSLWLRNPSEELGTGVFKKGVLWAFLPLNLQQYMEELCNNLPFLFKAAFPGSHSALQK